jgi:hypothetical protein
MAPSRFPIRDPRTVARDIPGVLDILFPRLTGGLVSILNREMFRFEHIKPVPEELVEKSKLQKAMVFELSIVRAESLLSSNGEASWDDCLKVASTRQKRHYDAKIPDKLDQSDIVIADHAAQNLVSMLNSILAQTPSSKLEKSPVIPGLGWIASGNGDFAIGSTLIEVKHTARKFGSGDFRQVLMYWLLKYAKAVENNGHVWSDILFLNPRRNSALFLKFDYLLRSASASAGRVELLELLHSIICQDLDRL